MSATARTISACIVFIANLLLIMVSLSNHHPIRRENPPKGLIYNLLIIKRLCLKYPGEGMNLGGQCEILLAQTPDGMVAQADLQVAIPCQMKVRVVVLLLGRFGDLKDEADAGREILHAVVDKDRFAVRREPPAGWQVLSGKSRGSMSHEGLRRTARTASETRRIARPNKKRATAATASMRRMRITSDQSVMTIMNVIGMRLTSHERPILRSHSDRIMSVKPARSWFEVPKIVQKSFQAGITLPCGSIILRLTQ